MPPHFKHAAQKTGRANKSSDDIPLHAQEKLDVQAIRLGLGMSQLEFSNCFGVPIGTLRGWEQGRRKPDGFAHTALLLIQSDPEFVLAALDRLGDRQPQRPANAARDTSDVVAKTTGNNTPPTP